MKTVCTIHCNRPGIRWLVLVMVGSLRRTSAPRRIVVLFVLFVHGLGSVGNHRHGSLAT